MQSRCAATGCRSACFRRVYILQMECRYMLSCPALEHGASCVAWLGVTVSEKRAV